MKISQVYDILNKTTQEVLGKTDLVINEDLSNIVDVGTAVLNTDDLDKYTGSLVDHVGRVVFVDRAYSGSAPSVLMDGWDYGAVMEKISMAELPKATENESWNLVDGQSYDPNVFYQPKVETKFYDKGVTFEVPMSFTDVQLKTAFSSAEQMNGFLSMIYSWIDKSLTIKLDNLIMRTICSFAGDLVYSEYSDSNYTAKSGVRAVNLLKLYNDKYETDLTQAEALTNPAFIKFASYTMGLYQDRLTRMSSLFNVGGRDRFTAPDMLHAVLLSDFAKAADAYLQSDTYHDSYTALPKADIVPYWQGTGTGYNFTDVSKISVKTGSGNDVTLDGIIGIFFDHDALGVTCQNRRIKTQPNQKAEFTNYWYKVDSRYFNDLNENGIVFFIK